MAAARRDLLAGLGPVAKALRRVEDDAAARAGITMWQYAVLAVVADLPGLNQGEVARALAYSPNRIIADLDLLERRRLLTRSPGPDRRANVLKTTAAGSRLMQRVKEDIHRGEDELLAPLTAQQRRALHDTVHALADALRASDSVPKS